MTRDMQGQGRAWTTEGVCGQQEAMDSSGVMDSRGGHGQLGAMDSRGVMGSSGGTGNCDPGLAAQGVVA